MEDIQRRNVRHRTVSLRCLADLDSVRPGHLHVDVDPPNLDLVVVTGRCDGESGSPVTGVHVLREDLRRRYTGCMGVGDCDGTCSLAVLDARVQKSDCHRVVVAGCDNQGQGV